jgi:TetR/AcrR family transcriptional regulator, transcriptional repressor for nem operon
MKAECHTKHKLLETATRLIWESSYGSVSVDDICQRAGVNKGSFYYFFPSKSDLAVAAIENYWQTKQPGLDHVFSAQRPPLERIEQVSKAIFEGQQEKKKEYGKVCGCPTLTMGAELSTQDEAIRIKLEVIMGRYIRYYESLARDAAEEGLIPAQDFKAKGTELFCFVGGLLMQAKIRNSLEPLHLLQPGLRQLLGLKEAALAA